MTILVDLQPTLKAMLEIPSLWRRPRGSTEAGCSAIPKPNKPTEESRLRRGAELESCRSRGFRALCFHLKLGLGPWACLCPLTGVTVSKTRVVQTAVDESQAGKPCCTPHRTSVSCLRRCWKQLTRKDLLFFFFF